MFRRRRRGLTVLPSYAGGNYFNSQAHGHNQNQGPYTAYPMSNQQAWGGYQSPLGPPPEQAPPPPYPGKPQPYDGEENSGYGYPHTPPQGPPEAPKPGGFVVPQPQSPSSPAPAHVNANSPWFRSS
ncbi:hypothetical protein L226DRAFT_371549 [Lentinus tigrinus ALCF2SS1-7]|nr:hypothetical protein L226DRAFT_371549 [Lentinus tigrinus ALCF2SS1-7]